MATRAPQRNNPAPSQSNTGGTSPAENGKVTVPAGTQTNRRILHQEGNLLITAVGDDITIQFSISDEALLEDGYSTDKSNVFASAGRGFELPGMVTLSMTAYRTFKSQKLLDYVREHGEAPAPERQDNVRVRNQPVSFRH